MLNRDQVLKALDGLKTKLFPDNSGEISLAQRIWEAICRDPGFSQRAAAAQSSFLVPGWTGNLNDTVAVDMPGPYSVISVDGSQIYPDRHMPGGGCCLINLGGTVLSYGPQSTATFFSEPHLFFPEDLSPDGEAGSFSIDMVDLKREEFELRRALQAAEGAPESVCLFDGSLIFWHLESKSPEVKQLFLESYLGYLDQFYARKLPIAGVISLPKSRELVNLIKLGLCRFTVADCIGCHKAYTTFPCKQIESLLDTTVTKFFLPEGHRTTMFFSTSNITKSYPVHLAPHFCYLDVGDEVVRIEMPAWMARDEAIVARTCSIVLDQSRKGRGYPVCLAEAHEQAVVKGADREFFYHMVSRIGISEKRRLSFSQKSIKKRGIGI